MTSVCKGSRSTVKILNLERKRRMFTTLFISLFLIFVLARNSGGQHGHYLKIDLNEKINKIRFLMSFSL